ncbi:MAG: hypothetical protein AMXMBFR55_19360 [Gemmatimonadota bacterium]
MTQNPDPTASRSVRGVPPEGDVPAAATIVFSAAIAAGLGELLVRVLLRHVASTFDNSFYLNPQAIWMGGLANLPLFALFGWVAFTLARMRGDPAPWRWVLGAVAWLGAFEIALVSRRLHIVAQCIAAAGIAAVALRVAEGSPGRIARVARRATVVLAAVSALGGVAWNVQRAMHERRAVAALPVAPDGAPNVLLLILDTVRASHLSVYGYDRPTTPGLERFAVDAIRFDRAIAAAPWTLPSHASIFTGRYPFELRVGYDEPLEHDAPTLAETLGAVGYRTGGFVANTVYGSYLHGLDHGFQRYRDYPMSVSELFGASTLNRLLMRIWNLATQSYVEAGVKDAPVVSGEFTDWLDGIPRGRPWFAFLNFFDAHMPYDPPAPYDLMFAARPPRVRSVYAESRHQRDSSDVHGLRDAYDGAIAYLDAELQRLFRDLEARGQLDNTVIIVTADHGEAFGEHGFLNHGSSLYLPEVHVPLLVRLPGKAMRGCVVSDWVSLRDIAATISELTPLGRGAFPGSSLLSRCRTAVSGAVANGGAEAASDAVGSPALSLVRARRHLKPWYPAASGDIRGLMEGRFTLLEHEDGRVELFDVDADPGQQHDLARIPSVAADRARLEGELRAHFAPPHANSPDRP